MKKKNIVKYVEKAITILQETDNVFWEQTITSGDAFVPSEKLQKEKEKTLKALKEVTEFVENYKTLEKKYDKLESLYETLQDDVATYFTELESREEDIELE